MLIKLLRRPLITVALDDLMPLVRTALDAEQITHSRAAELLGLSASEFRRLTLAWERDA